MTASAERCPSLLAGLGPALRWLRYRRGKKQYLVAIAAGITKGMLSGYESGRCRPSVESLAQVLTALGCNLNDLHNALQVVNGRPNELAATTDPLREVRDHLAAAVAALDGGRPMEPAGHTNELDLEAILDQLFTVGVTGETADRLVLIVDGPPQKDLGGWSRDGARAAICRALAAAGMERA